MNLPAPDAEIERASVNRTYRVPLYLQIKRELQRLIAGWDPARGRFYTDQELCRLFRVSRMTVRQAVAELVDEGVLTRTRGSGTFLSRAKLEERALSGSFERPVFAGEPVEIAIVAFSVVPSPADIALLLDVRPGERVRYVRRLRRHHGIPVRLDHRYLPRGVSTGLTRRDAASRSLIDFLAARSPVSRADMQLEARAASPEEAAALGVLIGDPLLVRQLVYYDRSGRRIMAGYSLYRSDLMRYAVTIPHEPGAPQGGANARARRRG